MEKFLKDVDQHQEDFVQVLKEAVAIPSVSSQLEYRPDVERMAVFMRDRMHKLGFRVETKEVGHQQLEGKRVKLPPVLIGNYPAERNPDKKTLLVYGHYDVQPALLEDGWDGEPFELRQDAKGRMYGRGSSDDKGPLLAWLHIVESHRRLNLELPVNLIVCTEGMEESGSEGLDDLIVSEKDKAFKDVDYVCISDNYWLGTQKPCLTYGLRGVSYFMVEVHGPAVGERKHGVDLHSGVFGGAIHEPMTDLISVMSQLVKPDGTIMVEGIMDQVAPLTKEEQERYVSLDFSMQAFLDSTGTDSPITTETAALLMRRWRYPTLSLHGIQNAFSAPGAKTVIPGNPIGKFSLRTVPNMEPAKVTELVTKYIQKVFSGLKSKNVCKVTCEHAGKWWLSSPNHENYVAAAKAVWKVYAPSDSSFKPDYTREGGSIPVTLTFEETLKKSVLLFPMGRCDDGAHSTNEKLDLSNYINGIKVLGAYLYELGKL